LSKGFRADTDWDLDSVRVAKRTPSDEKLPKTPTPVTVNKSNVSTPNPEQTTFSNVVLPVLKVFALFFFVQSVEIA
jgi:hypothetical protein